MLVEIPLIVASLIEMSIVILWRVISLLAVIYKTRVYSLLVPLIPRLLRFYVVDVIGWVIISARALNKFVAVGSEFAGPLLCSSHIIY